MNIEFIEQIVDSMNVAVLKLEQAIVDKNNDYANKLKVFIFDLYKQLDVTLGEKNVW